MTPSHYELNRLLARVAGGMSTQKDAETLRRLLSHYQAISCEV